jgi:glyoxylate reductase
MIPKVLITNAVPERVLEPLNGLAAVIMGPDGGPLMPREEVLKLAPELTAIINQAELKVDAALLDHAPLLKIVANVAIGINNLDVKLMAERGIWATNVPDAFVDSTADCTLGLMLNLLRKLNTADRYVRSGQWVHDGFQPGVWDGVLLEKKTLGIIGYGRIGRAVAARARAFGMSIIYHDISETDTPEYRSLKDLLCEADIISLHIPLTLETHHLINAERLALVKRGAYIINMARGPVIHEGALVAALQNGTLAGAALDVFEHEPHVHHLLLEMDNVCLTPHIGGGTVESRFQARRLCAENVAAVLRGERPQTSVNEPIQKR